MAHITHAQEGIAAGDKRDWDTAITKLTAALKVSQNPTWLIQRSKALNGAGRYAESLADAELAWHAGLSRSKRELVAEANYRRAVAYNRLGQYGNAACCCIYAMRIHKGATPLIAKEDPREAIIDADGFCTLVNAQVKAETAQDEFNKAKKGDQPEMQPATDRVKMWRLASVLQMQALHAMEKLPQGDPGRKVTATQKPEHAPLSELGVSSEGKTPSAPKSSTSAPASSSRPTASTPAAPQPSVAASPRLGDYQTDSQLTVSVFSKGVDKSKLSVELLPFSVNLSSIIYPNGEEKSFNLDLWGEIDPDKSKHTVTPSKVELVLAKKTLGKWPQIVKDKTASALDNQKSAQAETRQPTPAVAAPVKEQVPEPTVEDKQASATNSGKESEPTAAPSYPSSSRSGPKNWDNLDGGDSDDESDVNGFFKKLYKGATPEQQRAMMKSFTESNGTSLSTDWGDVANRTVETVPPEGVVPKKWN